VFIANLANYYLTQNKIKKIKFNESNIGSEGSQIISLILKHNEYIESIDLTKSLFNEQDLNYLISSIEKLDGFFSLNLTGVKMSLSLLKYITIIKNKDYKKEFILGNNNLCLTSKMTSANKMRNLKKKNKKMY
jgi:hypothetical protein